MALSRSRRSNAGSKMAVLLNSMESDDFYTTTYGGFEEVTFSNKIVLMMKKESFWLNQTESKPNNLN
jgi:hypothetical protein